MTRSSGLPAVAQYYFAVLAICYGANILASVMGVIHFGLYLFSSLANRLGEKKEICISYAFLSYDRARNLMLPSTHSMSVLFYYNNIKRSVCRDGHKITTWIKKGKRHVPLDLKFNFHLLVAFNLKKEAFKTQL